MGGELIEHYTTTQHGGNNAGFGQQNMELFLKLLRQIMKKAA